MRKLVGAAAGMAIAAVLSGCGGEESTSASETTDMSITKEDFVEQANAICSTGNNALATSAPTDMQSMTAEEFATYVKQVLLPNVRQQVAEIRSLGYPRGDEMTLDTVLTDAEKAFDQVEADPSVLQGPTNPFEAIDQQLKEYGLTACAAG